MLPNAQGNPHGESHIFASFIRQENMESTCIQKDVMDVIDELSQCVTEDEAKNLTKEIIEILGAKSFVYMTLLPGDSSEVAESACFFIGCNPALCKFYSERKWIMIDPFIDYARNNTAPITTSQIQPKTPGQIELMRMSAEHGFRSAYIVPTHTSMGANKRMGVLYVGSELPVDVGVPMLLRKRVYFSALGHELLLWWINRLRQQAMRKFSLLEEEFELLKLTQKGLVAHEIAAQLDITVSATYRKLSHIKEKFNVDKINMAIREAEAAGLLG